jgi:hypothetical protein
MIIKPLGEAANCADSALDAYYSTAVCLMFQQGQRK